MKAGDKVHIVYVDGEEIIATFLRMERGYAVVEVENQVCACLPAHLKKFEVIDESR